ncbi:MAG: homoserine O-succinyltransferase [Bacteroidales bacterium]|nr:homoserine O-succinyltransferase [Bacteroidales bacterium]
MPIRLPENLPAIELLKGENIFVEGFSDGALQSGDRPLQIVILNLMPFKPVTETDIVRVLSHTELELELTLMRIKSHTPTHTSQEHMKMFYKDFYDLRDRFFDGMIITGAPVEMLDYEQVTYWPELTGIFRWTKTHVKSTLYLCWAAQAALYLNYDIPKYRLDKKCFGIFKQTVLEPSEPIFTGFGPTFMMPHSRHTELHKEDLLRQKDLLPLAEAEETGVSILRQSNDLYVMGHFEYPAGTLDNEYRRDLGKRDDVDIPKNYYKDDNPAEEYIDSWREAGILFYQNWLNHYVL